MTVFNDNNNSNSNHYNVVQSFSTPSVFNSLSSRRRTQSIHTCSIPIMMAPTHHQQQQQQQQQQLGKFEELVVEADIRNQRRVQLIEYNDLDFAKGWSLQKQLLEKHRAYRSESKSMSSFSPHNTILLVQHQPVYTLGTASDASYILQSNNNNNTFSQSNTTTTSTTTTTTTTIPVVRMDRGGQVTYHGPGQWTVYPIFNLHNFRPDIHWYVRALEQVALLALQKTITTTCGTSTLHAPPHLRPNITGVFLCDKKVAAVGVSCKSGWITQHGLSVNVLPQSLRHFDGIVPCGLQNVQVGCVQECLENNESIITMEQFKHHLVSALEEVFQIRIDIVEE